MRIFKSCIQNGKMLYLSAFIIVSLLSFGSFLRAEAVNPADYQGRVIDSIEVAGNVYISNEKILSMVRSRAGQLFDDAAVREDVSRVAAINGVELAYYSIEPAGEKVRLIFVVKEKTVVRQITFGGEKNILTKKMAEEIGFARGDYLDKLTAQAGAEKLVKYFNKKGYPYAKVTFDDSGIEQGRLHYTIKSGTRVKIKKNRFEGNNALKSKELKKVVKSKPRDFGIFQNYFQRQVFDDDVVNLQKAYDKRGYLDTQVTTEAIFARNNKSVELVYQIVEGKQYNVEKIEFAGNEFLSDANLMSTLRLCVGQFYSNEKADYDRDEILKAYRQVGFINVKVESVRKFSGSDKIIAHFDITEGSRFRIGHINISGNRAVQDKVVRRVLDAVEFKPGQWYNADIARGDGEGDLEKYIKQDVYAETATITPVGDEPGQKDAEVRITEGKTGSIMFGAGVSSTDGLIGQLVYEQRNFDVKKWPKSWRKFFSDDSFKGAGQKLRIAIEPGTEVSRYSISFTEPYLKDKPIAMTVAASSWTRGRESYDEQRQKGYLGFTKRLKQGRYRTLSFRFENVSVEDIDVDAPKEVRDVKGDNLLAGIRIGFGRDTTDSRFSPTKGKSYELSYEQVGLDHTFGIVEGTYRWYKTLKEDIARRKTVLETKFYAATVVGDAPLFEKFYAGGEGSIRGFAYRGVSPRSGADNDPVGSKWIVTASGEIVKPLATDVLSALFFVDTGMIETGGIRASAGIGFQIMIPQWFGPVPMRFELAYPFMKSGDDDTQFFSFSVGSLF
ncbi:MAG: BamA/TamA family outer membrane protein [Phycisphaerae bacterium]|nr:BamA/TamA family outer membrane protein [Phycisphaerae bacterium]